MNEQYLNKRLDRESAEDEKREEFISDLKPPMNNLRKEIVQILTPVSSKIGELLGSHGITEFNGDEMLPLAVAEELLLDLITKESHRFAVEQLRELKKYKQRVSPPFTNGSFITRIEGAYTHGILVEDVDQLITELEEHD